MTKPEFIAALVAKSGVSKSDVISVIDAFSDLLATSVKRNGDKIAYPGLGTFEKQVKAARTGRNPITGDSINIPEKIQVKFKPAKELK